MIVLQYSQSNRNLLYNIWKRNTSSENLRSAIRPDRLGTCQVGTPQLRCIQRHIYPWMAYTASLRKRQSEEARVQAIGLSLMANHCSFRARVSSQPSRDQNLLSSSEGRPWQGYWPSKKKQSGHESYSPSAGRETYPADVSMYDRRIMRVKVMESICYFPNLFVVLTISWMEALNINKKQNIHIANDHAQDFAIGTKWCRRSSSKERWGKS